MDYTKFNNTLLICSKTLKNKIISSNTLINVKIMTMNELIKKLTFDYDDKAIYEIMQKENIKYKLAKMYIENIYYIENKEYENEKLKKLKQIKDYINEYLIYDELFKQYIKNKKIIILNHKLTKYEKKLLNNLQYEEIDTRINTYEHKVYQFKHIEDEVKYIGNKICELIENNINPNQIKLYNVSNDYEKVIKRNFNFLNLKVNYKTNKPLISTLPGKEFIKRLENEPLENIIEDLKNKYDNKIVNKIINICNKFVWSNYNIELIKESLKQTNLNEEEYENAIEIIDHLEASDDEYVFLMGFNEGVIPKSYKDEDYINDKIKMDYLDNTLDKNKLEKEETLKNIKSIKNLIITTKEKDNKQTYYISNLLNDVITIENNSNKTYSTLLDKIEYTKYMDDFRKYGTKNKNLDILASTYKIPYLEYKNDYKKIKNFKLNKKLELSYTSFQTYNECNFKYYISKILKLEPFEETFASTVGSLVHSILEQNLKNDAPVDEQVDKFINENNLTNKEKFFAIKIKEELKKTIEIIKYQKNQGDLDKALYEQKIIIENENYNLVGKIDKIMYKEENNNIIASLVDYKTGSADISLKYIQNGLGMQLPIYLYLLNNSKLKNVLIAGFYLQKIHFEVPKKSKKPLEEIIIDNLKLEGYTNKELVSYIDVDYENSNVIKSMKVKKDGSFSHYAKVLTNEEIKDLENLTKQKLNDSALNINNAEFTINPKKVDKKNISCMFCKFKDICFMKESDIVEIKGSDEDDTEETD